MMRLDTLAPRRHAKQFFSWWAGELRDLLPSSIANRLWSPVNQVVISREGGRFFFRRRYEESERLLGDLPAAGESDPLRHQMLEEMFRGIPVHDCELFFQLPEAACVRKRIRLPKAAAQALDDVVSLDMDRQTPFSVEDVYFDARIVGHDDLSGHIDVDLFVIPKTVLSSSLSGLPDFGLSPSGIEVVDGAGHAIAFLNTGNGKNQSARDRLPRAMTRVLGVISVILLVIVCVLPFEQQRRVAEALDEELRSAKERSEIALSLQQDIDRISSQAGFVEKKRKQEIPVIAIIDKLSAIFPDNTWIFRFKYNSGEVQVFGYSAASADLIAPLHESQVFVDGQFRAPLTLDPSVNAERFHLAFRTMPVDPIAE